MSVVLREACSRCMRRSRLIGRIAGSIDNAVAGRPTAATPLLALSDHELVAALASMKPPTSAGPPPKIDPSVGWVCRHSDGYPRRMHRLDEVDLGSPAVVWFVGDPACVADAGVGPAVTIIGTRKASAYGIAVAEQLGRGLAAAGVTVISGLALGIDAAAHRGVVSGTGRALAVLAGGADAPYPPSNRRLYADVVAHGAVISELPPGSPSFRWGFPARNRLMAALGLLTIVVECRERSGTLITVAQAQQLGRPVAAVPGPIDTPFARGSNTLLREGAPPILSVSDVLDELFGVGLGERISPPERQRPGDPLQLTVLEAIEGGESLEQIGERLSARGVRGALGQLELGGHLVRDPFGGYRAR